MARLSDSDIAEILERVIPAEDDVVVIFSGIWTFAHRLAFPAAETGDRLLDVIEDVVGSNRTVVLPAYTFLEFARARAFDLRRSVPEGGILTERVIGRDGWRRLPKPMNSYSLRGPRADEAFALASTTAWGPDGVLGWLTQAKARTLVFGVPWESCSIMHHAEETLGVPFRYYKRFQGRLLDDGDDRGACAEIMYARSLNVPPEWDISLLGRVLNERGLVLDGGVSAVPLQSAPADVVHAVNEELMGDNPYVYHTNADAVRAWVDGGGREREMAMLKPEERWPS